VGGPLYEDLADLLRQKIAAGDPAPGERLPSEAEIQASHGVSRHTTRRALELLEREGLVLSGQGRGWFVRDSQPVIWHASRPERNTETEQSPTDAFSTDVRAQGRVPSERISVAIIQADEFIGSRLKLGTGELVVARKRLRYVDGELVALADTFYPHDLVAGTAIAQPGDVLPGVYAVMEELGYGWDDSHRTDEIRSRPASREEAAIFGVEPGYALTEHVRTRRTELGRPVALAVVVAPGDRLIITYEGDGIE
jgi:GntR family transcriptional regulator